MRRFFILRRIWGEVLFKKFGNGIKLEVLSNRVSKIRGRRELDEVLRLSRVNSRNGYKI